MDGAPLVRWCLGMVVLASCCSGFSVPPSSTFVSRHHRVSAIGRGEQGILALRTGGGRWRPALAAMQVAGAEKVKELEQLVQDELSRVGGVEALDRSVELFSNSMPNRPWEALFTSLAASETFRKSVWAKEAVKMEGGAMGRFVIDCFTMSDVERHASEYPSSYAAQGALSPDGKGGWYMKRVGTAAAADASTKYGDVCESLKQGTVVLNSAGAYISPLASVSLAVLEATQLPVGLNLYITAPKMETSAPPHTDKQDVFVLQAQGAKHWRVFAPPAPAAKMGADPYARGKGPDKLSLDELEAPLIDTILSPGQLLYMPAGFPHTTDTIQGGSEDSSIHLTIGIDTHIWGLDYAFMRSCVLQRAGQKTTFSDRDANALSPELYALIHEPLPLGFLAADALPAPDASLTRTQRTARSAKALIEHISSELARRIVLCEPERWAEGGLEESLQLKEAANRFIQHYQVVMGIQRRMYLDGKIGITGASSTLQRVSQYMMMLDGTMNELISWSAGKAGGAASAHPMPGAPAAESPGKAKGKGMGMGGGGGKKKK